MPPLTLTPGTRLGPYEILADLGAGGMGEVYRARDSKLNRDVAIKVLLPAVANDPDRLARFSREAQVLASLNQPNIAAIYGLEDAGDVRALVMELVEGPTLADRIAHGAIPLADALRMAKQIADALEAAHEQGIIHRDLKPANIKVRPDGTVKVLDFGLAKAMDPLGVSSPNAMNSPTIAMHATTQAGMILGTAAYMSPEQAKGKTVDKRADIWAFGCVLYEMLTGQRAFAGEDVTDFVVAVMTKEPDWTALPAATPPRVVELLHRCLKKDARDRLRDIGDARMEMDVATTAPVPAQPTRSAAPMRLVHIGAVFIVGVVAGVIALGLLRPRPTSPTVTAVHVNVELGVHVALAYPDWGPVAILSPDDSHLAFVARASPEKSPQLYVRRLDQPSSTPLSGTDGASDPFFSPDSQWIGFFADAKLKKVPLAGGAAVTLCDSPNHWGGTWADTGDIFFTGYSWGQGLSRVPAAGGQPTPLTVIAGAADATHRWPQALPGGGAVLFTANASTFRFEDASIAVQRLPSGDRKVLVHGGYFGRYLRSGHLAYLHEGTLFVAPFDLERLEITGPAISAVSGVAANAKQGGAQFAVSDRGTLVYWPGPSLGGKVPILWLNPDGTSTPLRSAPAEFNNLRFSPDGRQVVADVWDNGQRDIWIDDWGRDAVRRLTLDAAEDSEPTWTPDGQRIAFTSNRGGSGWDLYWQRADGAGAAQRLTSDGRGKEATSWHPSGKLLAYTQTRPQTLWDIMILPLEGDEVSGWKPGEPRPIVSTPAIEVEPAFSPDGRWLAYESNESGTFEIYVQPFPGPGGRWQVSAGDTEGAGFVTWSRSRNEILYQTGDQRIMAVSYAIEGNTFRPETPHVWSQGWLESRGFDRDFDLHPDGRRLAVLKSAQAEIRREHITFVFHFFDELRRLAPTGSK